MVHGRSQRHDPRLPFPVVGTVVGVAVGIVLSLSGSLQGLGWWPVLAAKRLVGFWVLQFVPRRGGWHGGKGGGGGVG